jgi:hypothetical protein
MKKKFVNATVSKRRRASRMTMIGVVVDVVLLLMFVLPMAVPFSSSTEYYYLNNLDRQSSSTRMHKTMRYTIITALSIV